MEAVLLEVVGLSIPTPAGRQSLIFEGGHLLAGVGYSADPPEGHSGQLEYIYVKRSATSAPA